MPANRAQGQRRGETVAIAYSDVWRRAAVAIVGATLLLVAVAGLAHRQDEQHRRALLLREGSYLVALEREFLTQELRAVHSDLLFLAQQPLLDRLLAGDPAARVALGREYLGFARSKPLYDQVRFLDATGQEVVRVNRRRDELELVAEPELQSKANRYYFREAIVLEAGEVFVSPLDLNVERGVIERPPRPVVRLATPVVGPDGGRGLVVLNYAGAKLLSKLREIADASRGDTLLVNLQGEYLQSPDPGREWGWLLGHEASFRADYPLAWERIRAAEPLQVQLGGDLFTAEPVPLSGDGDSGGSAVLIISRIPIRPAPFLRLGAGAVLLALGGLSVIVALAFFWARASVGRSLQERRIAASEGRLRVLSRRLLAAQEDERRSLSRMLHDELGQRLTAIALDLKAALQRPVDAETEPVLRRAVDETEGVLSILHEMASGVRPSVLDDLGLEDAIESFVSEFEQRTGVSVARDLRLPPEGLSGTLCENTYRIVQEGLSNVATHGKTHWARVELATGPSDLELTIEDEGCGFDASTLKHSSRLGLLGMRERVELLGGEFALVTAPGQGTRIHVRLPLAGG